MRNDKQILEAVLAGFDKQPNNFLFSSPCWLAARAGEKIFERGACWPVKARMGRGYSVRIQTQANEYLVKFSGSALDQVTVERQ